MKLKIYAKNWNNSLNLSVQIEFPRLPIIIIRDWISSKNFYLSGGKRKKKKTTCRRLAGEDDASFNKTHFGVRGQRESELRSIDAFAHLSAAQNSGFRLEIFHIRRGRTFTVTIQEEEEEEERFWRDRVCERKRRAKMKTTKGGKVMNPTDAYRKELRKKELKRVIVSMTLCFLIFALQSTP